MAGQKEKYVFIDRDGVINKDGEGWTEYGYITTWEDFKFLPGVLEAFRELEEAGYRSVVISNQKCVGRGIMTLSRLQEITDNMKKAVSEAGGSIHGVFYCTHLDEDECLCRKPREGLFLEAAGKFGIKNFTGKYFIGDSERDIAAGKKAGLGTILVLSGKSSLADIENWENKPDKVVEGLRDAVRTVLEG